MTPMPSSTIASSPAVTCSPEATTASYSRASCSGAASRAQATSSLVLPAMAETTTATSWPASTSRLTWRATLRMRSISATEVPPNFITRRDMRGEVPGKSGLLHSGGRCGYAQPRAGAARARTDRSGGLADLRQMVRHQLQVRDETFDIRAPSTAASGRRSRNEGCTVMKPSRPSRSGISLAARARDGRRAAGERAGGGRAERDGELRLEQAKLVVEPPAAGLDLGIVRLLVDAALAARLELEVLHGIGDIDARRGRCRPRPARGRTTARPVRRTACPPGPPDRPAARRRTRPTHRAGPSPNTVCVALR